MKISISQLSADIAKSKTGSSNRRFRYPEKVKKATVRLFKQHSELTPKEFCQQIGISESALMQWTALDKASTNATSGSFIPVTEVEQKHELRTPILQMAATAGSGFVVIYVPGSRADLVAAVVRELGLIG